MKTDLFHSVCMSARNQYLTCDHTNISQTQLGYMLYVMFPHVQHLLPHGKGTKGTVLSTTKVHPTNIPESMKEVFQILHSKFSIYTEISFKVLSTVPV